MKFTLGWLKDHLETEAPLGLLTDALTDLGLEVEGVEDPAARLGAFRIARVIEAVPHPNADRLRLCRVETYPNGPGTAMEEVQVVCGAPNARTGLVGVFAPVGTHVPGTGVDLKAGMIRGMASNGMLCSERELMLSDDHDGIIDLPADAPLGARFIDWRGLSDPMIHVKVTPNRPDALGVCGIARDLAARGLGRLKPLAVPQIAAGFPCPVRVTIDDRLKAKDCPVFAGRLIRGVTNGASPAWMQARMRAVGLRSISALVDITNYMTFGLNRPLHVFDAGLLRGDLRVHAASGGETFAALDGRTYTLAPGMIAISDDTGVLSLAGIMGGATTGVSEATTDVFLESAVWDPITIATTGRALRIHSDARYRFERGIDPAFTLPGLDIATQMILDLCGGEASEVALDGAVPEVQRRYRLDTDRLRRLVGLDVPAEAQHRTLADLGFTFDGDTITPPSWRPDVLGDVDLVEEVARIASLSDLRGQPLPRATAGVLRPVLSPAQTRERIARRTLAQLGYNECMSYSFIDAGASAHFGGGAVALRIDNPISSEMTHLRPDLLPGLLRAAARNQARGYGDLALFEVGPVFHGGEPGEQSVQVAALLTGFDAARGPHQARRTLDPFDAKADLEAVLAALDAPTRVQITRTVPGWWHPGRSGVLMLGPKALATFGEVHPRTLDAMGVKGPAMAFTLSLAAVPVPRAKTPTRPALTLHDLQPVERDFAFVVAHGTEAAALVNAALAADKALIAAVRVFDAFSGERAESQMGAGLKSVALTVRLQPTESTLTEAEIEAVSTRIVEKVAKATGARLRV